jgi:hypothetical protein
MIGTNHNRPSHIPPGLNYMNKGPKSMAENTYWLRGVYDIDGQHTTLHLG